ncbi:zinc finger protein 407 isoform X1 [Bos indicus]|uniref:Zinc finger protein 407 isoform X1 n=2 Tax=Bos TaxID=9903 RepID=A0ABM4RGS2_BOSIN|nr:zinc finger protein 407 [Bos indicus x Bos taurus]XP_027382103.1 zinc finger protein 407 [Bos indicus x Bos taurus]
MMDPGKKLGSDEGDHVNEEAEHPSHSASHGVDRGPVSDETADSAENSTNKRGFAESSDLDHIVEEDNGNKRASKRMKLAEAEPLGPGEPRTHGSGSPEGTGSGEGVALPGSEVEPLSSGRDGSPGLPGHPSPGEMAAEKEPAQETTAFLDLGGEPPSPPKEMRGSGALGGPCACSPVSCPHVEKHAVRPSPRPEDQACGPAADGGLAFPGHTGQARGPPRAFSCELCGFQCAEENLLNAHCLGKTHLRRQNLAARGGFVQILTKQPLPKKPSPVGAKAGRTKPRASRPVARNGDSKALRSVGAGTFRDFRGSFSKQSGHGSELRVEMRPSRNTSPEKMEVVEENVTSHDAAGNPENQSRKLGMAVTSERLLDRLESSRNTAQAAPGLSTASRPRAERGFLVLGSGFRRRAGAFALKGQVKKRCGLLGVSKRGANEVQRLYSKHLRAPIKMSDAESAPLHGDPRLTPPETQAPKQDRTNAHLPGSSDSLARRPAPDHQVACTCSACGHTATSRAELEIHVTRCHVGELRFHCQTCGFSSTSRRDVEEHAHSHQHQQTASGLRCQCCLFTSPNEVDLRDHMKEKHSMGFLCPPCHLFFSSEKDMEEHRATEKHIHLLGQTKSSQSFNGDSALQTFPLSTLESENAKVSVSEAGKSAQEEPAKSRVSHGNEARHSSKPQFQCKKCFYKTRSSTVLTRHIKLRHGQDYHFLCKACNLYSLSKEGMEKHIKRSKHLENAKKNNIGLSFEECIERVCIGANDKKEELTIPGNGRTEGHGEGVQIQEQSCLDQSILPPQELSLSGVITKEGELAPPPTPKRGRPKGNISRTCSHCGLLASSITNLTVHIRRKHSHQYSYLCKVCKYYTVTKGDMERHCATKKHKGRVEIEASGKQSSDIVVGPEGGNLDASRKNTSVADEPANPPVEADTSVSEQPPLEQGSPVEVEVENVFHPEDRETGSHLIEKKEQTSVDPEDLQGDTCPQKDDASTDENRCTHCEFKAHSSTSLELHVKRKHTREFAFYCMACDYYAVTRREMTRHAATEKHKMKRQSYLNSTNVQASSSEVSKTIIIPQGQQQQNSEEFQIISDQPSETLKSRNAADCSILDENTSLDMSKVFCASDSVETETEEDSNLSEDHSFCETFQQPLAKDKVIKPEEMVPLSISSNCGSPSKFQNENSGSSALNHETAKKRHSMLNDISSPNTHGESDGGNAEDKADKVLGKRGCLRAVDGEHPAKSAMLTAPRDLLNLGSSDQDRAGSMQSSGDLKDVPGDPVLESKEILMNSRHETKVILEEDGPASDSTIDNNDVYETIISIDDKGQAVYSFGRFDSSIIRIKNPEDGELFDQSQEGLVAAGVRMSELPLKDCAQGVKKKKADSSSFVESTRIRCDDCGFLADGLSGLNVHIAMKHPTKEKHFHCLLCGKSFYTESNLHQHLASAGHMRNEQASVEELPEGGATFKCVKCTEPFDSEQNLFLHIKGQHEELLREVNKYIVEDTEQINREREENQGNVCKYCGKMCRSSNSMAFLAHIRTHTGSKPFKCKICHFATAQLGDARNHVKRHLGMREYKCHVCGVAFVMKKHLNTHLLGKHGVGTPKERKFTCHLCDRSFTEKWALNNHMKLHTGEKPFKCTWPTCHYSFLTASAMKDHYRTHTGEKSFLCDLCGFAGGTRHALTKHRRQHTGEKPFKCDECNFASTTQSHLTRHKRVHTGEKPYRCPWCDYRSNCAENIRKHILHTGKHEGVKMYNCPKCDYGTNIPVEFRNHLKEQHPDIENPDLAYLHAGIVSKSYECRLKGQGATFVETDSPFTAAALAEESPVKDRPLRSSRRPAAPPEPVQQVIIIQGYEGEFALDASVEETAAATLQTLALAGQVARVVHITEDGQVIAAGQSGAQGGSGAPSPGLPEPLADGATQVVVVGGSMEGHGMDEPLSPSGAVIQQVTKQEILGLAEAGVPPPDAASALDALLCAVTELGGAEGPAAAEEKGRAGPRDVLVQLPGQEAATPAAPEIHVFHDGPDGAAATEPVEVLTQLVRPAAVIASQERAQVAFKKVVQGMLQFAVCDSAAAGQLMKDGVTQVIVNEEGTVHMLAREGSQIIMQEAEARGPHVDLAEADGEISQIIVTEELVQAMVQESGGGFPEGATHYIVTELPPGVQDEPAVYSHTVIEAAGSQELLQAGAVVPSGAEQLTSMVIYTQEGSPAAAVIQSQRDSSEVHEA